MIKEKLQGTIWSLVTYQSENKHGESIYPLGEHAKGYIIFTKEDILSVHIMAIDKEQEYLKKNSTEMNTSVEQEMRRLGYHAYSGKFSIDEESKLLTTNVELSLISQYVGSQQLRKINFEGDSYLHLSNVKHPERKLVWKKIEN